MVKEASMINQKPLRRRDGFVEDTCINGIWYEDQCGERAWRIALSSQWQNSVYWVSGGQFRRVGTNTFPAGTIYAIYDDISSIDSALRQRIIKQIVAWEREPRRQLLSLCAAGM
jgi:hypothetical protein